MKALLVLMLVAFPLAAPLAAEDSASPIDQLLDRIVARESALIGMLQANTPIVETYIQEMPEPAGEDAHPVKDHYFLGKVQIGSSLEYMPLVERTDAALKSNLSWLPFWRGAKNQPMTFMPRGFAQMAFPDLHDFNRQTYSFRIRPARIPGRSALSGVRRGAAQKRTRPFRGPDLGGGPREFHRALQRHLLIGDSLQARAGDALLSVR